MRKFKRAVTLWRLSSFCLFIQQVIHFIGYIRDYAVRSYIAQPLDFVNIVYGPVLNGDAEIVAVSYESLCAEPYYFELIRRELNCLERKLIFIELYVECAGKIE